VFRHEKPEAGRGLEISVIGIPKTIDNEISFVQETFNFETAITEAKRATYKKIDTETSLEQRPRVDRAAAGHTRPAQAGGTLLFCLVGGLHF
jgi:hypothetical protein